MSKSKDNVVSPDDMVARYGADATRCTRCLPRRPTAIWTGRKTAWRREPVPRARVAAGNEAWRSALSRFGSRCRDDERRLAEATAEMHQTTARITLDFEGRWHFNTCVAAIMEYVNELQAADEQFAAGEVPAAVVHELLSTLVLLLAPLRHFFRQRCGTAGREGPFYARRGRRAIRNLRRKTRSRFRCRSTESWLR